MFKVANNVRAQRSVRGKLARADAKKTGPQAAAPEAARGALDYGWRELRLAKICAGHHPDNRASRHILEQLGFTFLDNVFYGPTGLLHPSYVCTRPDAARLA